MKKKHLILIALSIFLIFFILNAIENLQSLNYSIEDNYTRINDVEYDLEYKIQDLENKIEELEEKKRGFNYRY